MQRLVVMAACAVGVIIANLAAGTAHADRVPWQLLHGDQGNSKYRALAGPLEVRQVWHALDMRPPAAVVAISPTGERYTVTMDGGACHLWALNPDGSVKWCSDEVGPALTITAVDDDGAVFVDDGVHIFGFEHDGTLRWKRPVPASPDGASGNVDTLGVTMNQGFLIVVDGDGVVRAIDPATGEDAAPPYRIPAARSPLGTLQPAAGFERIGIDSVYTTRLQRIFQGQGTVVNNSFGIDPRGRMFVAANRPDSTTAGRLYGIDFTPPSAGSPGALSPGCHGGMGARSQTSPTVSLDGRHVYAGDGTGTLFAFRTTDCAPVWSLPPESGTAAPASPTVGPDGRVYTLVGGRLVAVRDDVLAGTGSGATRLWTLDPTPRATADGFAASAINSTVALTDTYLYASANYTQQAPGTTGASGRYPAKSFLYTIDPANGSIVASVEFGEVSASSLSLDDAGRIYVPTKALGKATAFNNPAVAPFVPEPATGVYAFAPASYAPLLRDGLANAQRHLAAALAAEGAARAASLERADVQRLVAGDNLDRATAAGEIDADTACGVRTALATAGAALVSARGAGPEAALEAATRAIEAAQRRLTGPDDAASCPAAPPATPPVTTPPTAAPPAVAPPSRPGPAPVRRLTFTPAADPVVQARRGYVRLGCRRATARLRSCTVEVRHGARRWGARTVTRKSARSTLVFAVPLTAAAREALRRSGPRDPQVLVRITARTPTGERRSMTRRIRIAGR